MRFVKAIAYAILLFVTQAKGDGVANTNTSSGKVVVVLGDETATGLAISLVKLFEKEKTIQIVDSGRPGEISMFTLARVGGEVLPLSPSVVVMSIGRYDLIHGRYELESALNTALVKARCEDVGAKVIMVDPKQFGETLDKVVYDRIAVDLQVNINKFLRGEPKEPVLTVELVDDPRKMSPRMTIAWASEPGVVYELIEPYPFGTIVGWNTVRTVTGGVGEIKISVSATSQLSLYRVRASWEQ